MNFVDKDEEIVKVFLSEPIDEEIGQSTYRIHWSTVVQ